MFLRQALDLRVVDLAGRRIEAVLHGLEDLAGEIDLGAVREMAAVIEAHAENRVARIDQREIGRGVGLRAGVRLHVGVVGTEQLLGAIDRQLLGDVDVFATAVIALARIAFGVLVGQHRCPGLPARAGWRSFRRRSARCDLPDAGLRHRSPPCSSGSKPAIF